ncbi:hypothetical protein KSF73_16215 [Burkholderiaceae bacterium DAT-1]|nr:hypothetical protein [Burkholderiaceae bacterium DAT-1]
MNVLPQYVLISFAATERAVWLGITLAGGALASIAGVHYGSRFQQLPVHFLQRLVLVPGLFLVLAFSLAGQPAAYLCVHVLMCFLINALTLYVDCQAFAHAGRDGQIANDRVGTGLRFAGMLLGPILIGGLPAWAVFAVALLIVVTLRWATLNWMPIPPASSSQVTPAFTIDWKLNEWAVRLIYAAYCLLAANAVYLLQQQFGRQHAIFLGGAVVSAVYASAVLFTFALGIFRLKLNERWILLPAWMLPVLMAMLVIMKAMPLYVWFLSAILLGCVFAIYMLAWRQQVSTLAAIHPDALKYFNNLPNTGALLGFVLMLCISPLHEAFGQLRIVACSVSALSIFAVIAGLAALQQKK